MNAKILAVDDDASTLALVKKMLEEDDFQVICGSNGEEALQLFEAESPVLVLLDVVMPPPDGLEVCRRIRDKSNVPIILVTVRDHEVDQVVGLEMGADEYVTKPFSARVLLARVRAHLRRVERATAYHVAPTGTLNFGDLVIDLDRHDVNVRGETVKLRPLEYRLLVYFARNPEKVLEREQIYEDVWGDEVFIDSRALDVHIRHLREKIEADPANPQYIVTVRGFGYKFVAPTADKQEEPAVQESDGE